MEKYAVVIDDDHKKTAEKGDTVRCPICGKTADMSGNVPKCPEHGTEPFEAQWRE